MIEKMQELSELKITMSDLVFVLLWVGILIATVLILKWLLSAL